MKSSSIPRRRGAESEGYAALACEHDVTGEVLDLRELEAPEPLQRILEACATLAPGAGLAARTPRYPEMLLPQLESRGLAWQIVEEPDGSGLVRIRRPA